MRRGLPRRADGAHDGSFCVQCRGVAGIVLQDASGRILVANKRAAQVLDASGPAALAGRPALFEPGTLVRMDGSEVPIDQQPGPMALRTGEAQGESVLGFRRAEAAIRWFRVGAEPLFKIGRSVPYAAVWRLVLLPQVRCIDGKRSASGQC